MKRIMCDEVMAARLFEYCEELLELEKIMNQCSFEENDDLAFMTLCFLSKQFEHLSAIQRLFPHTDIQLIARTMVEGLIQLIWCHTYPENARKWRSFAWISDWRLMNYKESCGDPVSDDERIELENVLEEVGHLFRKNRFKEGTDPYHNNWRCGVSLKSVANELGGTELYSILYSDYSDWQHWGVASIGAQIERRSSAVHYSQSVAKGQLCSSLSVAFLCTFQMIEIASDYFELGLASELDALKKEYVNANKESMRA